MHAKCANNENKSSPLQFTAVPSTTRTQTNKKCIGYQIQTYDCQAGQAWQEGQAGHGRAGQSTQRRRGKQAAQITMWRNLLCSIWKYLIQYTKVTASHV